MTVRILLVEDEVASTIIVREALRESGIEHELEIASDGEVAVELLRAATFLPQLVLLDLNLPKKTGLEVLKEIKDDPRLRVIPVIIFTNSRTDENVTAAYSAYCNAFLEKNFEFDELVATLKTATQFWFEEVVLPS